MDSSRFPAYASRIGGLESSHVFSPAEFGRFLQSRISLIAKVAVVFILIDYALSNGIAILGGKQSFSSLVTAPRSATMLLNMLIFASIWRICSRGTHSLSALRAMDAFGVLVFCSSSALEAWMATEKPHSLVGTITAITFAVMGRAVFVPGSARRTLWLSALAYLPLVLAAYDASRSGNDRVPNFALFAIHCGLGTALATIASAVIFRLERQVRKAEQLGQYRLEQKVGAGAMGEVYRARHAMLRRPTAVKILREEMTGNRDLNRFEREVQLTSQLTHPNTIAIYDYGRTPDGTLYYAMEFLDGMTLEELVKQHGPQPAARVIHILKQICASLTEAHTAGLIHRDIKPANVILCERGQVHDFVKLVDFGLVKHVEAGSDPSVSVANAITGTPLYMSPEAIRSPDEIDHRSDLYAVGAVGYFLLTGSPMFQSGNVMEICNLQMNQTPEPPSQRTELPIPAALEALLMKALAKQRKERPQSAHDFRRELDAIQTSRADRWGEDEAAAWWTKNAPPAQSTEEHAGAPTLDAAAVTGAAPAGNASTEATLSIDLSGRGDVSGVQ